MTFVIQTLTGSRFGERCWSAVRIRVRTNGESHNPLELVAEVRYVGHGDSRIIASVSSELTGATQEGGLLIDTICTYMGFLGGSLDVDAVAILSERCMTWSRNLKVCKEALSKCRNGNAVKHYLDNEI